MKPIRKVNKENHQSSPLKIQQQNKLKKTFWSNQLGTSVIAICASKKKKR